MNEASKNNDCRIEGQYDKTSNERTYIEIAFFYDGELYVERIYTDQIDINHYESVWDWWFKSGENDSNPNLVFELTAEKNIENKLTTCGMYINVYKNEESNEPIKRIDEIAYRKSWTGRRAFI